MSRCDLNQTTDCRASLANSRAGERVMASVSRFLTQKLRLTVNEAKSAMARPEERKFLGVSISNDGSERRIASKALDKFKTQIRDMTRRTRGIALQQLIEDPHRIDDQLRPESVITLHRIA
jgi:RNA-directed DNA polymerase